MSISHILLSNPQTALTPLSVEFGTVKIDSGAASGYILTSDASGNATWQPNTGPTPGDNITVINSSPAINVINNAVNTNGAQVFVRGTTSQSGATFSSNNTGESKLANLTPGNIGIMDITTIDGNINLSVTNGAGGTTGNINLNPYMPTGAVSINGGLGTLNLASMSFDNGVTEVSIKGPASPFTPVLSFGGGSTGITYSSRVCQQYMIGKMCYINIYIALSSKGSSTGAAAVSIPLTSTTTTTSIPLTYFAGITSAGNQPTTFLGPSTSSLLLLFTNTTTGAITSITDTNFSNSSGFVISGSYLTP
jgi:hypothetical protein